MYKKSLSCSSPSKICLLVAEKLSEMKMSNIKETSYVSNRETVRYCNTESSYDTGLKTCKYSVKPFVADIFKDIP